MVHLILSITGEMKMKAPPKSPHPSAVPHQGLLLLWAQALALGRSDGAGLIPLPGGQWKHSQTLWDLD